MLDLERATLPHCLHFGLLCPRCDFGGVSVRLATTARVPAFIAAEGTFAVALLMLVLVLVLGGGVDDVVAMMIITATFVAFRK